MELQVENSDFLFTHFFKQNNEMIRPGSMKYMQLGDHKINCMYRFQNTLKQIKMGA